MDVCERNTIRRPRIREVSSRYKSPSPSPSPSPSTSTQSTSTRRCPSPNLTRTESKPALSVPKRSISAERKRPSTPPSPQRPSTPIHDSSRRASLGGGRLPESLWPSTMRSLSVSFQSDSVSVPVSKKEKPVVTSDRTLRPSSNVGLKQSDTTSTRSNSERKSPLKGRNLHNQSENAKPSDGLHSRSIDQHRWPSRIGGKVSTNSLNRSVDLADKSVGLSSVRRTSKTESLGNPQLKRSASDTTSRLLSLDGIGRVGHEAKSFHDNSPKISGLNKFVSPSISDRTRLPTPVCRSHSSPTRGSRPQSPSKPSGVSSSVPKGVGPSRARPSTPPSRGVSPSRIRSSSSCVQGSNSASVLSFIADFKKGTTGASYIDDAHHLRLLYNRYLQWRFTNAREDAVLYLQNVNAEKTLYGVWNATLNLWDSIIDKRLNLHQLKLENKLNSVLKEQMVYLDNWALLERDHINSLSGAVEDLEANTIRLPVTGGAKADIESLKIVICSAVDVMQAMGSSICSLLSRVEGMDSMVSQLAVVVAQEKAMLDECKALLASTAARQIEEYSLISNGIQMRQALMKDLNMFHIT